MSQTYTVSFLNTNGMRGHKYNAEFREVLKAAGVPFRTWKRYQEGKPETAEYWDREFFYYGEEGNPIPQMKKTNFKGLVRELIKVLEVLERIHGKTCDGWIRDILNLYKMGHYMADTTTRVKEKLQQQL